MSTDEGKVKHIINKITAGDHRAVDELIQTIYKELRLLATRYIVDEYDRVFISI